MHIVLLGATGLVGEECLKQLVTNSIVEKVTVIVRSKIESPHPKAAVHVVPFDKMEDQGELFKADAVICALGTTIKKARSQEAFRKVDYGYPLAAARAAHRHGCRHYLLVSSIGANVNSLMYYTRIKGEMERDIIALGFRRTTIVRPSLLLGKRKEFRFGEWMGKYLTPLMPEKYKAVQASTVASALISSLFRSDEGVRIIDSAEIGKRDTLR